jgi:uncharacterized membrane protein YadS
MNISPNEAEEALAAIQKVTQRTRRSVASSGAYIFLFITGIIWLVGFLANQFLSGETAVTIWIGISLLGSALSILLGSRMGRRVRGPSTAAYVKRIGTFWLLLVLYGIAAIAIARPTDGKQMTMLIILFIMIGQMAMGLLFSFSSTWWALPITALALAGYYLLPEFFYLWMAVLVGGGMIVLGLYIRLRW